MLCIENHRYLSDLLSYADVGARPVEDQQHRLAASGDESVYRKFNGLKTMLETEDVNGMREMMCHSIERRALFDKK